ncbi:MAG TPA: hypothetical protein VKY85_06910 [Candidatus Angelobacter sp.]|nr:hypothetical protein [Candidatus Angelobacter sp.]
MANCQLRLRRFSRFGWGLQRMFRAYFDLLGFLCGVPPPMAPVLRWRAILGGVFFQKFFGLWIGVVEHAITAWIFKSAGNGGIHAVLSGAGVLSNILRSCRPMIGLNRRLGNFLLTVRIRVRFVDMFSVVFLQFTVCHVSPQL